MNRIVLIFISMLVWSMPALANTNSHGNPHARVAERIDSLIAHVPKTFQFTNVRNIALGPGVAAHGGASLIRSKNHLEARMMIADLEPGHAYSFWWIVFNAPRECASTPCADTDLMRARGGIHYASGAVAADYGVVNLTFTAAAGGPPEGAQGNPSLPERGLVRNRGFKAEVHLVAVDHGVPALADFGMEDPDIPGTWGWELTHALPPGPAWVRAAIFLPE